MDIIRVKNMLKKILGKRMEYDGREMFIDLCEDSPVDPARIMKLSQKKLRGMRLTPDYRLIVPIPGLEGKDITDRAKHLLGELVIEEQRIF
jgi:transcription-repair coupling factor (superfamily II helicase)